MVSLEPLGENSIRTMSLMDNPKRVLAPPVVVLAPRFRAISKKPLLLKMATFSPGTTSL